MASKKKEKVTDLVINKKTVVDTLKAYKTHIASERKAMEEAYQELYKREDAVYKLEQNARVLEGLLETGLRDILKAVV